MLLLDLQGRDAGGSCCCPLGVGFSGGQEHLCISANWWINIPVESLPDGCGCFFRCICLALSCSEHCCWMWPPWVRFPTVAEHTVTCQQGLGSLVGIS